jgi:hypothetical protein
VKTPRIVEGTRAIAGSYLHRNCEEWFPMSVQSHHSGRDLRKLSRAFDLACRELGIGITGLDVQKRERLIRRAMKLAHANDQRAPEASLGRWTFSWLSIARRTL